MPCQCAPVFLCQVPVLESLCFLCSLWSLLVVSRLLLDLVFLGNCVLYVVLICRNYMRPKMTLSSYRKDFSLLLPEVWANQMPQSWTSEFLLCIKFYL